MIDSFLTQSCRVDPQISDLLALTTREMAILAQ